MSKRYRSEKSLLWEAERNSNFDSLPGPSEIRWKQKWPANGRQLLNSSPKVQAAAGCSFYHLLNMVIEKKTLVCPDDDHILEYIRGPWCSIKYLFRYIQYTLFWWHAYVAVLCIVFRARVQGGPSVMLEGPNHRHHRNPILHLWISMGCPMMPLCYDMLWCYDIYYIYIYIVCVIMCVYMRVYLRACVCVCVRIICQNMWYHQWPICVIMIHRCFLCPGKSWPKACGLDTSPIGTPSWPSCCSIDLDYPYSVDALHLEYSPPYTYT